MLMRRQRPAVALLLVVALLAAACATTALGKSIQAADLQKQLVEASAVEFAKLHFLNDPKITPAIYAQGKANYEKWAAAQRSLAQSLATWKTVSDAPNEAKLQTALESTKIITESYLTFVAQFVNLDQLKKKIGG